MKALGKIFSVLALAFLATTFSNITAYADNLDTYRNLLTKKTYTIKYTNITPQERKTNKDKYRFSGGGILGALTGGISSGIATDNVSALTYAQLKGIVTSDGKSKYEESGNGIVTICKLRKGDKEYKFSRTDQGSKGLTYYGIMADGKSKKGNIQSITPNWQAIYKTGESYGDTELSRLLNAMMPNGTKSAEEIKYEQVGSGWLDNGLNYIDYRSDSGEGAFEVIRYYFNGYTLKKIASAKYYTLPDGSLDGTRCIISIDEFSPTPEAAYFELPKGLKEKEKKADKEDN